MAGLNKAHADARELEALAHPALVRDLIQYVMDRIPDNEDVSSLSERQRLTRINSTKKLCKEIADLVIDGLSTITVERGALRVPGLGVLWYKLPRRRKNLRHGASHTLPCIKLRVSDKLKRKLWLYFLGSHEGFAVIPSSPADPSQPDLPAADVPGTKQ